MQGLDSAGPCLTCQPHFRLRCLSEFQPQRPSFNHSNSSSWSLPQAFTHSAPTTENTIPLTLCMASDFQSFRSPFWGHVRKPLFHHSVWSAFLFFGKNLFLFGCTESLLLCVSFLELQQAGATYPWGAWASHCSGFSGCRAQAPGTQASGAVMPNAQPLCSVWILPGQGLNLCPLHSQADSYPPVTPGKFPPLLIFSLWHLIHSFIALITVCNYIFNAFLISVTIQKALSFIKAGFRSILFTIISLRQ